MGEIVKVKMTEEQIQERITKSTAKLKARRIADEEFKAGIKEGVAYVHENKIHLFSKLLVDGSTLVIGAEQTSLPNVYHFAYALCSSKDQFSLKTSKGLIGSRLKNDCPRFSFEVEGIETTEINSILGIGFARIQIEALRGCWVIPDRLRRAFATMYTDDECDWGERFFGRD